MPADDDHQRVAADLRQRIASGELVPGDPIPSRSELREQYGVGDGAAREAMRVLRADGLIEGTRRRRLTVAHPPAVRVLTDPSVPWPHGVGDRRLERVAVRGDVAALLDVPTGTRVQCERVELLDPDGRTSHLLVRYTTRRRPAPGRHAVGATTARVAAAGEAGMLGLAIGSVLLVVRVIRLGRDGRPAAVEELLLPADRWQVGPA